MKKFLSFLLFALCVTTAANAQFLAFDFENGNILTTVFTNDETYPWIVIDTTDDDGNAVRCIMSGNKGVASSTSAIETTVGFASDGYITFDALCMGEGTGTAWDRCIFYIDGEAQFTYGAHIAGWNHYAYNVSAGSHTFKWVYMKDSSVNPTGDAFFVDNISFGLGTLINIIGFTEPAWGEHPDNEVGVPDGAGYYVVEGQAEWGMTVNDVSHTYVQDNIFNNENADYHFSILIAPNEGCSFTGDETVMINGDPNIIQFALLLNGYYVIRTIDFQVTEPVTPCVIDTIEIYGFTEPVYGEHPDYAMSVPDGAHYSIDYVDWNWWNVDEDNGDILGADEFFDNEDNVYYMYFQIIPKDGCTFADNVTVKVNGDENIIDFEYTGYDETDGFFWAYTVDFEVEAPACVITAVNVIGYESPVAGENSQDHLNITVLTVPEDANYSFYVSPRWFDDDAYSNFYDIFVEGTHYSVGMTLEANSGCVFDDNCTFYVNGNTTLVDLDYSGVYSTGVKAEVWTKSVAATGSTTEPCAVPSNLTATDITGNTATLEWTGYQDNYNIKYAIMPINIDTLFFEDFENGLPSTWTTIDNDGDGYNWTYHSNVGLASGRMIAHSGDGLVYSESYYKDYGQPLFPDNWLITPLIDLNGTMKVWLIGQDPSYASEHFAIYLSTTGTTVDDFTTTLVSEQVATGEYVEYTADLSAYAGQQGYIAIRHFNVTDQFILNVDDFGVFLDDDWTTVTATDNFVDLTGLDPETPYIVQVQGICDDGVSVWSEPVEFTTTEEPTCVINTIEITGFTEPVYGATPDYDVEVPADADYTLDYITWMESSTHEMNTTETFGAKRYYMVFDIAPNEGCTFADEVTVTINGDASLVDPDYGGILSNVYKYRVFTIDYYLSVPPCETPTNVTVSDITTNNATVSWTGSLEEYNVLYGTNLINYRSDFETDESVDGWSFFDADGDGYNWEWWTTFSDESHSGTSFLISQSYSYYSGALDPDNWLITPTIDLGGTMSVWVRSWYSSYLENFAIYLTTNPDYEGVEDFNIELVGQTTAPYEWTEYTVDLSAYVGQRGAIAIRHFNSEDNYILLVDDFSVIDGTAMTATGNSIELTDLDPETTYEVQVQGICEYSVSAWSEPVEFTTEAEPAPACEAPTGLAASNITATTAKLEWTGSQDQYTVRYKEDAASDWTTATTANSTLALTGLTPATTYTAQVQGDCGTGAKVVTDWSEPVTFTTLSGTIEPGECGPAVDCEGTSYPTVKIGDVCWMAKNLAAETCVTTGNVYAYVNDQFPDEDANVETYGLLYDEEAAFATGLCPEGYTLPTTEQFEYLKNNFTVEELRNSTGWVVNTGTNGTGFSWDGSGFRNGTSETFEHLLMEGYLWTVDMTSGTPQPAMYKMMYYCNEIVRVYDFNGISASVRCVKIAEPQPEPQPEPEPFRCGTSNLKIGENSYETVQIGTQCWTKTNLRETKDKNGHDFIDGISAAAGSFDEYENAVIYIPTEETWSEYNSSVTYDENTFGYYYNWVAANNVCPDGWHLPSDEEWTTMEQTQTSMDVTVSGWRGDHAGKLAGGDDWQPSSTANASGNTTYSGWGDSGFSAVPAGYCSGSSFNGAGYSANFWSSTQANSAYAWDRGLNYGNAGVSRSINDKGNGYSVRCLRDAEE